MENHEILLLIRAVKLTFEMCGTERYVPLHSNPNICSVCCVLCVVCCVLCVVCCVLCVVCCVLCVLCAVCCV